jgi:hypothetical protein
LSEKKQKEEKSLEEIIQTIKKLQESKQTQTQVKKDFQ